MGHSGDFLTTGQLNSLGAKKKLVSLADTGSNRQWAGLDLNQRKLTLTGLQPQTLNMQRMIDKEVTALQKILLQDNLQGCSECLQNALPSELFEVVCVWKKFTRTYQANGLDVGGNGERKRLIFI